MLYDTPMNEVQVDRFFDYLTGGTFYDDDGCDYKIETPMKPQDALDQIIFPLQQMGIISAWYDICVECGKLIKTAREGTVIDEDDERVKSGTPEGYYCDDCIWPHLLRCPKCNDSLVRQKYNREDREEDDSDVDHPDVYRCFDCEEVYTIEDLE